MGFLCNAFLNMINTEPKDKMKSKIICGNTYYDGCLFPKFDINNRNDIISVIYQYHGLKTIRSPNQLALGLLVTLIAAAWDNDQIRYFDIVHDQALG